MRGRKAKPDHLKIVTGTARSDRMNPDAPEPSNDLPVAPDWLTPRAREHFGVLVGRLEEIGIASRSHTEDLATAAMRLDEIEACTELIELHGYQYETVSREGQTMWRANPALAQRNEAARHLQSLLAEFGLSPATASKASVKQKPKPSNPYGTLTG